MYSRKRLKHLRKVPKKYPRVVLCAVLSCVLAFSMVPLSFAEDTGNESNTAQTESEATAQKVEQDSNSSVSNEEVGSEDMAQDEQAAEETSQEASDNEEGATGSDPNAKESTSTNEEISLTAAAEEIASQDEAITPAKKISAKKKLGASLKTTSDNGNDGPAASVGDNILIMSDEGRSIVYHILSNDTVGVGSGAGGTCVVVNGDTKDDGTPVEYNTVTRNYTGAITIPETVTYNDHIYTVTAVNNAAFGSYSTSYGGTAVYSLSKIVLPSTVTTIGPYAFEKSGLTTLAFTDEDNVRSIGDYAFADSQLAKFNISSKLQTLGDYALATNALQEVTSDEDCSLSTFPTCLFWGAYITKIDIPSSVKTIESFCFRNTKLDSITIPSTVTSLGKGVCRGCENMVSASFEANTITELPAETFYECNSLYDFTIPSFIKSIEQSCFYRTGFESLTIPSNVTYIGSYAFADCEDMEELEFAEDGSILSLSPGAFMKCRYLTAVTLPSSLRTIGEYCFAECDNLEAAVFPASIRTIGAFAYSECEELNTVLFEGDASGVSSEASAFYKSSNITSVVYRGKRNKSIQFVSAMPTSYYSIAYYKNKSALDSGECMGYVAFAANITPESATLSDVYAGDLTEDGTMTKVASESGAESGALFPKEPSGCNWQYEAGFALEKEITNSFYAYGRPIVSEVNVGDTFVVETEEGVDVTYVVLQVATGTTPGKVAVGTNVIHSDSAVSAKTTGSITLTKQVVAPDAELYDVTSIAPYAFANCTSFMQITIPETVTSIGSSAFYRCSALRNIFFEGDASSISGADVFSLCGNIKLVVYGDKKANLIFGTSSPDVYYTVRFYDSKHDFDIGNVASTVIAPARTVLSNAKSSQFRSGTIPSIELGYEWCFEEGLAYDKPLTNSGYAYVAGIGFQANISILDGNVSETPCWFRALSYDEERGRGTCCLGLGIDGVSAIKTGVSGTPVIPSTVTDEDGRVYTVTAISDYAFGSKEKEYACALINGIQFSSNINSIGKSAFEWCTALESVKLPSSVLTMGEGAFAQCESLSSASLTLAKKLSNIPDRAFQNCVALTGMTIPAGAERIGKYAFSGCEELSSLSFSNSGKLKTIDEWAFYKANLEGSLVLPDGLESVGKHAFYEQTKLTGIVFPAGFSSVAMQAFYGCDKVASIAFMGDARNVTFGNRAFCFTHEVGRTTVYGTLGSVIFYGKKSHTIEKYIETGKYNEQDNDYGRSYSLYYVATYYKNQSNYDAGVRYKRVLLIEGSRVTTQRPSLGKDYKWRYEKGFSSNSRATDSFYVIGGYDLSKATITGLDEEYSFTGGFIKPKFEVYWTDGRRLTEGVDYELDSDYGLFHDGYANNYRMGTASVHIAGIGTFAGTCESYFRITSTYDAEETINISLADPTVSYTYDGTAHCPAVKVTATLNGKTYSLTEGRDYTISYRDNVNAGTGFVSVTGLYKFSSTTELPFIINPYPLELCDVQSVDGNYAMVSNSVTPVPNVTSPIDGTLVNGKDFTLEYQNNTSAGEATVFIVGKGNYTGFLTDSFTIIPGGGGDGDGNGGNGDGDGGGGGSSDSEGDGSGNSDGNGSGNRNVSPGEASDASSPMIQRAGGKKSESSSPQSDSSSDDNSNANSGSSSNGYKLIGLGKATPEQVDTVTTTVGISALVLVLLLVFVLGIGYISERRRFEVQMH